MSTATEGSVDQAGGKEQEQLQQQPEAAPRGEQNTHAPRSHASREKVSQAAPRSGASKAPKANSKMPDWIAKGISPRGLKMLLRCWVATWVTFILIFPQRSLETLGQAAFFCCMVTIMIPGNLPVFIWLLANSTLVIGACFGWAWGAAGMAAAGRARDQAALTRAQQEVVQRASSAGSATNPEAAVVGAVFTGAFLDTKSTVVFGVFFVVGCYFFGVITVKAPKLKIFAMFGTIVLCIMCMYGPLFPRPRYTLATIFMLPIGASLGVSFACMLLIFPETLSYSWTADLIQLLSAQSQLLATNAECLHAMASDANSAQGFEARFAPLRLGIIGLLESLNGQQGFLELESSYARVSSKDLRLIFKSVGLLSMRLLGLGAFHHMLESDSNLRAYDSEGNQADDDVENLKKPIHVHDTIPLKVLRDRMREAIKSQGVEMEQLLPRMEAASERTFAAARACLSEVTAWLTVVNVHRWFGQQTAEQHEENVKRLLDAAAELEAARVQFKAEERLQLLQPYEKQFQNIGSDGLHHLEASGEQRFLLSSRPLHQCFVFCVNLDRYALSLHELTSQVHSIAVKRPRSKVWMPTGLRKLHKLALSKRGHTGGLISGGNTGVEAPDSSRSSTSTLVHDTEDEEHESPEQEKAALQARLERQARARRLAQRDLDALPPSHFGHKIGRSIAAIYDFVWSPEGAFALRYAIVGFALWIPQVIPSSSRFVYAERGVWATIMALTGMALTSGEQTFSIITRLFGTVLGGLLGAAFWYIGSGSGNGNPYGLAAVMGVAFIPIVFLRIFGPPILLLPAIMGGVTVILVVGYSWQNTHLIVTSLQGVKGIDMAWRRALLVIIGMAASVIVTLFPRPPSGREAVRKMFGQSASSILVLYTGLVEGFMILDSPGQDGDQPSAERSIAAFRSRYLGGLERLKGLSTSIAMAKLDFQIRGKWPAARYEQMLTAHARMFEALAQMYAILLETKDDVDFRRRFAGRTPIVNPDIIQDITTTLTLLQDSLIVGRPLPHPAAGSLIERTIMKYYTTLHTHSSLKDGPYEQGAEMSLELARSPQYWCAQAGICALVSFVQRLDEFGALVHALVGEVELLGFDALRDAHNQRSWRAMEQRRA